ncbi:uncharacterized protein LOC132197708 isoform X2 [Neocloeon triangulifer]|uniref:uncharacterized protein LOC132197708 isoform X2 n=1 Tax=Neocloeon triangulifer TaxID=2078957 RepID=UPI00286F121D|nr:uncharacterized protein LOC132197708 isoform X2 [Neocloeon triangulifer]
MEAYAGGRQKTNQDNFDDLDLDLEKPQKKKFVRSQLGDAEELEDNDLRLKLLAPTGQKKGAAIKINLHTNSKPLAETRPNAPPPARAFPLPGFIPIGTPPARFPNPSMGSPSFGLPFNLSVPPGALPTPAIATPGPSPAEKALAEQTKQEAQKFVSAAEKQKELQKALGIEISHEAGPGRYSYRGPLYKKTTGKNAHLYSCHVCQLKVLDNDIVNHNNGKKHKANMIAINIIDYRREQETAHLDEPAVPGMEMEMRRVPLCQTMLDKFTDSPIIGLEYLVELMDDDVENCHVVCFLCDKRGENLMQNVRQNIISHMIGTAHRMNYLKRHFAKAHEALLLVQNSKDLKLEMGRFVRTVVESIEREYGRLKPMLVLGRTFRAKCEEYKEATNKQRHFCETPSKTFVELVGVPRREPSVESLDRSPRSPGRRERRGRSRSPIPSARSRSPRSRARSRSPRPSARSRSPGLRLRSPESHWNPSPVQGRSSSPGRRRSPIRRRGQSYRKNTSKSDSISPEGGSSRMSPFDERLQQNSHPPPPVREEEESGQEVVEILPKKANGKTLNINDALRDTTPISNSGSDMSLSPEPVSPGRHISPVGIRQSNRDRLPKLDNFGREVSRRQEYGKRSRSPDSRRAHQSRRHSRSPRRNRRSLSCSPISSRSGSRSPRPRSRLSDSRSTKTMSIREKWDLFKSECDEIEREIKKKRRHYQTQPEKHPAYNEEWKIFWNKKQQEVKESGRNPAKYDYTPEWKIFWNERVEELYIHELQDHKRELRRKLGFTEEEGLRPRSSKGSKSASKGGSVSDIKDTWKALTGGDIKGEPKPEPKPIKPDYRTVLGMLRHLTALEPQLGSLGPTVNKLLGRALAMEKVKKDSSEDILLEIENTVMLETIKEKFRGQLMAGIVERFNVGATKNAINNIGWLLDHAPPPVIKEQIQKAEEAPKVAAAEKIITSNVLAPASTAKATEPKKEAVSVPGVGNIDRNAIALQIASALLAQGKTDITNDELEQLVEAVVGMAQKKNEEASEKEKKKEEEQMAKMEELVVVPDDEVNTADMSEDDLISCLKIFEFLPEHEKHSIIMQLQRLEETDPEKVKELRKYVNAGTEMNSQNQLFGKIDSDEEDYLDSDVLNAAKKNVEQQIKPKAADAKTVKEATDSMMAGLMDKRPDRRSETINTELPLPPIGDMPSTAPVTRPTMSSSSQNVDQYFGFNQPPSQPTQPQLNSFQQYPPYPPYGGQPYGYYPQQNWALGVTRPSGPQRNLVSVPLQSAMQAPVSANTVGAVSRLTSKQNPALIHLTGQR